MQCTAHRRNGSPCRNDTVKGATVCRMHGGTAPAVRRNAMIRHELSRWTIGDPVDDPGLLLLAAMTQARIRAAQHADALDQILEREGWEHAFVGDSYAVDDEGNTHKVGEYARQLAQWEARERQFAADLAVKALTAGIAERQIHLAEQQGTLIADILRAVLNDPTLGLTDQQRARVPGVTRRVLTAANTA